jgi:hypothetical protein
MHCWHAKVAQHHYDYLSAQKMVTYEAKTQSVAIANAGCHACSSAHFPARGPAVESNSSRYDQSRQDLPLQEDLPGASSCNEIVDNFTRHWYC